MTKSKLLNGQNGRQGSRWCGIPEPGNSFKKRAGRSFNCHGESVRKTVKPGWTFSPLRQFPTELPLAAAHCQVAPQGVATAVEFLCHANVAFYCITDLCQHYSSSQILAHHGQSRKNWNFSSTRGPLTITYRPRDGFSLFIC